MTSFQHRPLSQIQLNRARILAAACGALWPESIRFDKVNVPAWTPAMLAAFAASMIGEYESLPMEGDKLVGADLSAGWRWSVDPQGEINVDRLDGVQWVRMDLSTEPYEISFPVAISMSIRQALLVT
jgi:hypothetical protein